MALLSFLQPNAASHEQELFVILPVWRWEPVLLLF